MFPPGGFKKGCLCFRILQGFKAERKWRQTHHYLAFLCVSCVSCFSLGLTLEMSALQIYRVVTYDDLFRNQPFLLTTKLVAGSKKPAAKKPAWYQKKVRKEIRLLTYRLTLKTSVSFFAFEIRYLSRQPELSPS